MHVFTLTRETTVKTARYKRVFLPSQSISEAGLDRIYIVASGENELVQDAVKAGLQEGEKLEDVFMHYPERACLSWEHMPMRLGRASSRMVEKTSLYLHEEAEPLPLQLDYLKKSKPGQRHFRLALVNGFGGNSGDTIIGASAFREVAQVVRAHLPSVSFDYLLGPGSSPASDELLGHEDGVAHIYYQGVSLQEFARYDAYFDISGLITLPRYYELPVFDWYLWWFGLDYTSVDPARKRNHIHIPLDQWQAVTPLLAGVEGKKIFFNPRASVALRSIPDPQIQRFVTGFLHAAKDITIVMDAPLNYKHKRLLQVGEHIDTPLKFAALMAQCDGAITVDSFAPQVADALALPTVHLSVSMPVSTYCYYPHSQVVLLPEAETLPAWLSTKLHDDSAWDSMKDAYAAAWAALDPKELYRALSTKMEEKPHKLGACPPRLNIGSARVAPRPFMLRSDRGPVRFRHDAEDPLWQKAQERCTALGCATLKTGSTVLLCGAAEPEMPLAFARKLGGAGMVHIFEPRPARTNAITTSLYLADMHNVTLHSTIPMQAEADLKATVSSFDPWNAGHPARWGNLPSTVSYALQSVRSLDMPDLDLVVVQPPMPLGPVAEDVASLLEKFRPVIVFSVISEEEAAIVYKHIAAHKYIFWAEALGENKTPVLLLALPDEKEAKIQGFMKVEYL